MAGFRIRIRSSSQRICCLGFAVLLLAEAGCSTSASGKSTALHMPWSKRTDVPAKPAGYKGSKAGDRDPFLNPSGKDIPPPDAHGSVEPKRISPAIDRESGVDHLAKTELGSPISLVSARPDADEILFADYTADPKDILKPTAAPRGFKYIVLHQSNGEAGSLATIDRTHRDVLGWESCGFHFIVGNGHGSPDGRIEAAERWKLQKQGAHVTGKSALDFNLQGIGICMVGDFDKDRPTPRQVEATKSLIAYLMRTYNIPPYRVLTHGEVNDDTGHGRKCPGPLFQVDQVLPMAR